MTSGAPFTKRPSSSLQTGSMAIFSEYPWRSTRMSSLSAQQVDSVLHSWKRSRGVPMSKALQQETLVAWAINGEEIPLLHGAPLRLCTPLKYGIKNIRRPSTFHFARDPQPDFWGERGYSDWVGL